jgi:hypothetical protein
MPVADKIKSPALYGGNLHNAGFYMLSSGLSQLFRH